MFFLGLMPVRRNQVDRFKVATVSVTSKLAQGFTRFNMKKHSKFLLLNPSIYFPYLFCYCKVYTTQVVSSSGSFILYAYFCTILLEKFYFEISAWRQYCQKKLTFFNQEY